MAEPKRGADTGKVTRVFDYDDRPEAQHVALRIDEIEALILNGGAVFHKDTRKIVHFLNRVVATLREQGSRIAKLQTDVEHMREEKGAARHPMARATQAISELDDKQKRQLLDGNYLQEMAKLERARETADMVVAGATNETNRIRLVLSGLLEDPQIASEVKQHVRDALIKIGYQPD